MEEKQEELTRIQCPTCMDGEVAAEIKGDHSNTIFEGWQAYAAHIREMHSADATRMQWADDMDALVDKQSKQPEPMVREKSQLKVK